MQDQLLFVISSPRSGSTLLQRMLGSHSRIFTHPEPHMLTPLAYLGYHDTVDKAPYDHINAAEAIREFVSGLPNGEADYLDAVRAYTDTMYGRMLATSGKRMFLDKTPAYALVADFVAKLYPKARYVVLTRHPLAVLSSFANTFFEGDYARAHDFNPILERYVPAIAKFIRSRPAPMIVVRYEDLVRDPGRWLEEMFEFCGLEHEESAIEYGKHDHIKKSFGDPVTVNKHDRPMTEAVEKWATELATDPAKLELSRRIIDSIDPADLETWGYGAAELWAPLERGGNGQKPAPPPLLNTYRLKRQIILALKKDIHENQLGKAVKKVRYFCDVLLRE
ncbi:MAG: sulfotransferase [Deltaproteobacteria bacterium]|nr:sulfotransferase [Deltaproteobacteria bacterium]